MSRTTHNRTGHQTFSNENGENPDFHPSNERTALIMDAHVEESLASSRPLSGVERESAPTGRRPKRTNRTSAAEYGVREDDTWFSYYNNKHNLLFSFFFSPLVRQTPRYTHSKFSSRLRMMGAKKVLSMGRSTSLNCLRQFPCACWLWWPRSTP